MKRFAVLFILLLVILTVSGCKKETANTVYSSDEVTSSEPETSEPEAPPIERKVFFSISKSVLGEFLCSYDSDTEVFYEEDRNSKKVHLSDEEYLAVCAFLEDLDITSYEKDYYNYCLTKKGKDEAQYNTLRVRTDEFDKTVSFVYDANLYSHGDEAGIKLSNTWSDIYNIIDEAYLATFTRFSEDAERTIISTDDIKSFLVSWGYNADGFNGTYDSKDGKLFKSTPDGDDGNFETRLILPDETVQEILEALVKLDIEVYPDYGFVPFEYGGYDEYIFDEKPKSKSDSVLQITVRTKDKEKIVRCVSPGISRVGKDEYGQKFLDTFFLIRDSIVETKEWVSLPKYEISEN